MNLPVRPRLMATTSEAAIDAATASVGVTQALCCQTRSARAAGLLEVILSGYEPKPLPAVANGTTQPHLTAAALTA